MRTTYKTVSAILAVLSLILLPVASAASSAKASAFPLTLKLADGTFTFRSKPTSIVSISPTGTEMLFAIGAGPQVKAVDSDSDYPRDAPITKLDAYQPNVEAIAKYKPDLVVVSNATSGFDKLMAALKIPVMLEPAAANLTQDYAEYTSLGRITGDATGAAHEVAAIKASIAHTIATTPRAPKGATYYYELDPTFYSVTSTTFVGKLFALLGLTSIADTATGVAASGGYPQLSAQFILKANPTYILLADTICCHANATTVSARPGWSALSAVTHHRVVTLNDDIASRWGPRITILLRDVANALKKVRASSL